MKRIITIAVIALVVSMPSMASAQSPPDYVAHYNTTKAVLIDWVDDAINSANVTFNTYQQQAEFQDKIQQIHQSINTENWTNIVTLAAQLSTLTTNIQGANSRALVTSLCESLEAVYTDEDFMLLDNADAQAFQDALASGNPDGVLCDHGIEFHIGFKEITIPTGDGGHITLVKCSTVRWVIIKDNT